MCPKRRLLVIAVAVLASSTAPRPCTAQTTDRSPTVASAVGVSPIPLPGPLAPDGREAVAGAPAAGREPRFWIEAGVDNGGLGLALGVRPWPWLWTRARLGGSGGNRSVLALEAGPVVSAMRGTVQAYAGGALGSLRCSRPRYSERVCADADRRGAASPTVGIALRAADDSDWWLAAEAGYWFPFAGDALARSLGGIELGARVRRYF